MGNWHLVVRQFTLSTRFLQYRDLTIECGSPSQIPRTSQECIGCSSFRLFNSCILHVYSIITTIHLNVLAER